MSDPIITSYETQQGRMIYTHADLPKWIRPFIGTQCLCPCHIDPHHWPPGYRDRCCATLHRQVTDDE